MSKRKRIQQEVLEEEEPVAKKQRLVRFENAQIPDFLDIFPGEIVERIFSHLVVPDLVNCGVVCKYFFEISKSVSLWRHHVVKTSFESLKAFGVRAWCIMRLNLDDVPQRNDLARLVEICPNLIYLDLVCSNLRDEDMEDLLKFPDLRVLNLEACKFTDKTLKTLSRHPSLRSLAMLYSTEVTEAALNEFIANSKTLKHLSITYFIKVPPTWKTEARKKYPDITFEDDDDNDEEFVLNGEDEEFEDDHDFEADSDNVSVVYSEEKDSLFEDDDNNDEFEEEDDDSESGSVFSDD